MKRYTFIAALLIALMGAAGMGTGVARASAPPPSTGAVGPVVVSSSSPIAPAVSTAFTPPPFGSSWSVSFLNGTVVKVDWVSASRIWKDAAGTWHALLGSALWEPSSSASGKSVSAGLVVMAFAANGSGMGYDYSRYGYGIGSSGNSVRITAVWGMSSSCTVTGTLLALHWSPATSRWVADGLTQGSVTQVKPW